MGMTTSYKSKLKKRPKNQKMRLKENISKYMASNEILVVNCDFQKNNQRIDLTDEKTGDVIAWFSGGKSGFKSKKKISSFATKTIAQELVTFLQENNVQQIKIKVENYNFNLG